MITATTFPIKTHEDVETFIETGILYLVLGYKISTMTVNIHTSGSISTSVKFTQQWYKF
uniref:Uncharacterized protein n=1 Tax=Octopus bimaculoides TaxID=37653 RepID=A0A0L8G749_OCTBM